MGFILVLVVSSLNIVLEVSWFVLWGLFMMEWVFFFLDMKWGLLWWGEVVWL